MPARQCQLFALALDALAAGPEPVNEVVEIMLDGDEAVITRDALPA